MRTPAFISVATFLTCGIVAVGTCLPISAEAQMRPGGWSNGGYERDRSGWSDRGRSTRDDREGKVTSEHFVAEEGSEGLGHGAIRLVVLADSTPEGRDRLDYEAAMIDRLVLAGYDTLHGAEAGQRAEIRITRDVAEPAEERRSPVSGESSVMVSNRGTAYGMALNVDLTKPRAALMATRMDLRIRDEASGAVLWEARATIYTRDGDESWDEAAIANRLAAALMDEFPPAR